MCEAEYYDIQDDCDCECGAYDPDCDNPNLTILGCPFGYTCGGDGRCVAPPDEDDCGCTLRASRETSPPWWLALFAVFWWRSRRES